jgi:hypothetical protein
MSRFSQTTQDELLALHRAGASPLALAKEVFRTLGGSYPMPAAPGGGGPADDGDPDLEEDTAAFLKARGAEFTRFRQFAAMRRRLAAGIAPKGHVSSPGADWHMTARQEETIGGRRMAEIVRLSKVTSMEDYKNGGFDDAA